MDPNERSSFCWSGLWYKLGPDRVRIKTDRRPWLYRLNCCYWSRIYIVFVSYRYISLQNQYTFRQGHQRQAYKSHKPCLMGCSQKQRNRICIHYSLGSASGTNLIQDDGNSSSNNSRCSWPLVYPTGHQGHIHTALIGPVGILVHVHVCAHGCLPPLKTQFQCTHISILRFMLAADGCVSVSWLWPFCLPRAPVWFVTVCGNFRQARINFQSGALERKMNVALSSWAINLPFLDKNRTHTRTHTHTHTRTHAERC